MILYLRWPLHPNHICINYAVLRVNIRYSIGLRRLLRTKWLGARDPSSLLSVPVLSKRRKLCPVAQGYWNFLGVFILQTNHAWSRTSKLFLGLNKTTLGLVLASYSQPNRHISCNFKTDFTCTLVPPTPPPQKSLTIWPNSQYFVDPDVACPTLATLTGEPRGGPSV